MLIHKNKLWYLLTSVSMTSGIAAAVEMTAIASVCSNNASFDESGECSIGSLAGMLLTKHTHLGLNQISSLNERATVTLLYKVILSTCTVRICVCV